MNNYRKLLKYGRLKEDREDNYKIITSLLSVYDNRLFKMNSGYYARLFQDYLNGHYNKTISLMLDRLDEICVRQYSQNAYSDSHKRNYKDWLDINEKHLYSATYFHNFGLIKGMTYREYQKYYRIKKKLTQSGTVRKYCKTFK
jgi:hypothetical protein